MDHDPVARLLHDFGQVQMVAEFLREARDHPDQPTQIDARMLDWIAEQGHTFRAVHYRAAPRLTLVQEGTDG